MEKEKEGNRSSIGTTRTETEEGNGEGVNGRPSKGAGIAAAAGQRCGGAQRKPKAKRPTVNRVRKPNRRVTRR